MHAFLEEIHMLAIYIQVYFKISQLQLAKILILRNEWVYVHTYFFIRRCTLVCKLHSGTF